MKNSSKILLVFLGALVIFILSDNLLTLLKNSSETRDRPTPSTITGSQQDGQDNIQQQKNNQEQIQIVAADLEIPWEIAFLSDSSILVTERPGTLVRIFPDRKEQIQISGVAHVGEGGLQGLVLDPNYEQNNYLYLYMTTRDGLQLVNRVVRYTFNQNENKLTNSTTIIDEIPGARFHDGGRIAFGPDNLLYIATGDAGNEEDAQNTDSLAGKILRIKPNGEIPEDNPFKNAVYSYGHRNIQGLAWDKEGRLWATEHGPSGSQTGNDEINLIEKGANYGWPIIKGNQARDGMKTPVIESGTETTWAPAGAEIFENTLLFVGLRGEAIYKATIEGNSLTPPIALFEKEFGRIRFIKKGPDNLLYIGTSNRDGRGSPNQNDDRIIKIDPSLFDF